MFDSQAFLSPFAPRAILIASFWGTRNVFPEVCAASRNIRLDFLGVYKGFPEVARNLQHVSHNGFLLTSTLYFLVCLQRILRKMLQRPPRHSQPSFGVVSSWSLGLLSFPCIEDFQNAFNSHNGSPGKGRYSLRLSNPEGWIVSESLTVCGNSATDRKLLEHDPLRKLQPGVERENCANYRNKEQFSSFEVFLYAIIRSFSLNRLQSGVPTVVSRYRLVL